MSDTNQFSNQVGTISGDRLTFYAKSSLVGSRRQVDVPVRHVSSVKVEVKRSLWGVVLGLVGLALFAAGPVGVIFGLLLIGLGVILLWGTPSVVVTAGIDKHLSVGPPWNRPPLDEFANALRSRLFPE